MKIIRSNNFKSKYCIVKIKSSYKSGWILFRNSSFYCNFAISPLCQLWEFISTSDNIFIKYMNIIWMSIYVPIIMAHNKISSYYGRWRFFDLSYLFVCSCRMSYWLMCMVAIERVYVTWSLKGTWLKSPRTAKCIIATIIIGIGAFDVHELIYSYHRKLRWR